jgi:hypothetical protein
VQLHFREAMELLVEAIVRQKKSSTLKAILVIEMYGQRLRGYFHGEVEWSRTGLHRVAGLESFWNRQFREPTAVAATACLILVPCGEK